MYDVVVLYYGLERVFVLPHAVSVQEGGKSASNQTVLNQHYLTLNLYACFCEDRLVLFFTSPGPNLSQRCFYSVVALMRLSERRVNPADFSSEMCQQPSDGVT